MRFADLPHELLARITALLRGQDTLLLWTSGDARLNSKLCHLGVTDFRLDILERYAATTYPIKLPFRSLRSLKLLLPTTTSINSSWPSSLSLPSTLQTLDLTFAHARDFFDLLASDDDPLSLPSLTSLSIKDTITISTPLYALSRLPCLLALTLGPVGYLELPWLPRSLTSLSCQPQGIEWPADVDNEGFPPNLEILRLRCEYSAEFLPADFPSAFPPSLRDLTFLQVISVNLGPNHARLRFTPSQVALLPRDLTSLTIPIGNALEEIMLALPPRLTRFRPTGNASLPASIAHLLPKTLEHFELGVMAHKLPEEWVGRLPPALKELSCVAYACHLKQLPMSLTKLHVRSLVYGEDYTFPPLLTELTLDNAPTPSIANLFHLTYLSVHMNGEYNLEALKILPQSLTSLLIQSNSQSAIDCSFFRSLPSRLTGMTFSNPFSCITADMCLNLPKYLEVLSLVASQLPGPANWQKILPRYLRTLNLRSTSLSTEPMQEPAMFKDTPYLTSISLFFGMSDVCHVGGVYVRHLPPQIETFVFWAEATPSIPMSHLTDLPRTLKRLVIPNVSEDSHVIMNHIPKEVVLTRTVDKMNCAAAWRRRFSAPSVAPNSDPAVHVSDKE